MKLIIAISLCCIVQMTIAQEGVQLLKETYDQLTQQLDNSKNEFYVKYDVNFTFHDDTPPIAQQIQIATHNGVTAFICNDIQIYEDKASKVSVIPHENIIHITPITSKDLKASYHDQLFESFNHLINQFIQKSYDEKIKNQMEMAYITFVLPEASAKKYQVAEINYVINKTNSSIESITFKYHEDYDYSTTTLSFIEFSIFNSQLEMESRAQDFVFEQNGNKKSPFTSFQILEASHQ